MCRRFGNEVFKHDNIFMLSYIICNLSEILFLYYKKPKNSYRQAMCSKLKFNQEFKDGWDIEAPHKIPFSMKPFSKIHRAKHWAIFEGLKYRIRR